MVFLFYVFAIFSSLLCSAWGLMLLVGAAHSIWWSAMPTMGYGDATALVLIATLIGLMIGAVIQGCMFCLEWLYR